MTKNSAGERLYNGLLKENPTFVLMLGVSYVGSYHFRNQWLGNGAYHRSGTGTQ